ncbi:MAG: S41 family peptidase [Acidimicrobiia bacterium]
MRISFLLASVIALIVSSCQLVIDEAVDTTQAPDIVTTTTTTTVPPTTTTSIVDDELVTTSCPTPDEAFAPLCEAYQLITEVYVDPVDAEVLADAAILGVEALVEPGTAPGPLTCPVPTDAFVRVCEKLEELDVAGDAVEPILYGIAQFGLDPNSAYIDPQALELIQEEQTGSVEGIGALVTTEDLTSDDPANTTCNIIGETCPLIIVSLLPGSPAAAAGVQPGDVFVAVDGEPIAGRSIDEVTAIVRGPAGTDVSITFDREGTLVDVVITRASIEIPVTLVESFGEVGYLRLNMFTSNAGDRVEEDLRSLLETGATTIVLDLRDNPGGTLDAALDVTSEFLADGVVVRTVGPDEERTYPVRGDGIATDPSIEVIVVVNRGSASASEVLAGALQERGRATVVGETTFGKNTVQQRFPLSNGGAMRLTIARWITAGGLDFDNGIVPDVVLPLDPGITPSTLVDEVLRVLSE